MSGRLSMLDNTIYDDYNMFAEKSSMSNNFKNEAVKTIHQSTILSEVFFSKENIDYIQNKIQSSVHTQSNGRHRIGRQSETELSIIMRSIYLQFARNSNIDIRGQITELDNKVVDECVPTILSGIEQYLKYKTDVSTLRKPMEMPQSFNSKGEKSLEYKPYL
jgi:hypothetical protein